MRGRGSSCLTPQSTQTPRPLLCAMQIVVLGGPDKGKTGKLIGMDGDAKGTWASGRESAVACLVPISASFLPPFA